MTCPKCDGFLVQDDEGDGRRCVNCGRRVTAIEVQRITEREDQVIARCRKKVTSGSCQRTASEGSEFCEAHAGGREGDA